MSKRDSKLLAHASAMLGLSFVIICSMVMNSIYKPQKPVMQYLMPVSEWEFTAEFAQVSLAGYKIRECPIVAWRGKAIVSGVLKLDVNFEWMKLPDGAEETTDTEGNDTFPKGYIYPSPARWTIPDLPLVNKLGFELDHDCGGVVLTSFYWYDIPHPADRTRYERSVNDYADVPRPSASEANP